MAVNTSTPTRTALVTGGTGGLGSAVTTHLLETGWRVVVPWLVRDELSRLGEHPNLRLVQADLSDPLRWNTSTITFESTHYSRS